MPASWQPFSAQLLRVRLTGRLPDLHKIPSISCKLDHHQREAPGPPLLLGKTQFMTPTLPALSRIMGAKLLRWLCSGPCIWGHYKGRGQRSDFWKGSQVCKTRTGYASIFLISSPELLPACMFWRARKKGHINLPDSLTCLTPGLLQSQSCI